MCFSTVVSYVKSCWESCTYDPSKLYDIGMKYKADVNKIKDYKTIHMYVKNAKYFLDAAAKLGHSQAQNERVSLEKGLYSIPVVKEQFFGKIVPGVFRVDEYPEPRLLTAPKKRCF